MCIRATGLRVDRIHREAVLREDSVETGRQEGTRDHVDDVARTGSERDAPGIKGELLSQLVAQPIAGIVRIEVDLARNLLRSRPAKRTRAKGVLVGSELDRFCETELALEFFKRLAGHIGMQPGNTGRSSLQPVSHKTALG